MKLISDDEVAEPRYKHPTTNKAVPSVTEIIAQNLGWGSESLRQWALYVASQGADPNLVANEAATLGTALHKRIEQYCTMLRDGESDDRCEVQSPWEDKRLQPMFNAWREWFFNQDIAIVDVERKMFCDFGGTFDVAGTMDMLAYVDGKLTVLDWKTSNSDDYKKHHIVQLAGYAGMYNTLETERCEFLPTPDGSALEQPKLVEQIMVVVINRETAKLTPWTFDGEALVRGYEIFSMLCRLHKMSKLV